MKENTTASAKNLALSLPWETRYNIVELCFLDATDTNMAATNAIAIFNLETFLESKPMPMMKTQNNIKYLSIFPWATSLTLGMTQDSGKKT